MVLKLKVSCSVSHYIPKARSIGSFSKSKLMAFATLVKGWSNFKKYLFKMDINKFAYSTYKKALSELRNYALVSINDELNEFLTKMQMLDNVITDFTSPTDDSYEHDYQKGFRHDTL